MEICRPSYWTTVCSVSQHRSADVITAAMTYNNKNIQYRQYNMLYSLNIN